jgi:hypothetical protein
MPFSDYVVYVDESGDHSLQSIDSNFPVFSLVFCIFKKSDFVETVVPVVQRLGFNGRIVKSSAIGRSTNVANRR